MGDVLEGLQVEDIGGESTSLKVLLNTKNYELTKILSEVPPELTHQLTVMNVVARRFQSGLLRNTCRELYLHQIAKDRKGRLEAVEIASSQAHGAPEEE